MSTHQHEFAALWWNFGQYKRQDVHVHSCANIRCNWVIIGPGRNCDGDHSTHWEEKL